MYSPSTAWIAGHAHLRVYRFVGLEALPACLTDFACACGRPTGRFSVLPRNLPRYVASTLEAAPLTIASLRSLYEPRPTLYEHQQWAKDYLDLSDLAPAAEASPTAMLALHAAEVAHPDELERRDLRVGESAGDRCLRQKPFVQVVDA